ncbi:hypothetical protein [Streptomyces sp. NPDC001680]
MSQTPAPTGREDRTGPQAAGSTTLHGYGRLPWHAARRLLHGCACTWTDFDGVQLTNTPPEQRPLAATHLWGWTTDRPGRLVRLRFDTDAVYAAVLGTAPADPQPILTEQVTATERPAELRPANDQRAGALPPAVQDQQWELTEIPGEHPVTFVRGLS